MIFPYLSGFLQWSMGNTLHWRHDGPEGVSNHQPRDCLYVIYNKRDRAKLDCAEPSHYLHQCLFIINCIFKNKLRRHFISKSKKNWLVLMHLKASQITSLAIVYSTVYSGADQRKTSKLRATGLCVGNSPVIGEFSAQMASNAENISIWWRHHECGCPISCFDMCK